MTSAVKSVGGFWSRFIVEKDAGHIRERQRRDDRISTILDRIGFSFRVYLVAFLGFLASSWSLISVTIVTPALYFIYDRHGQLDADAGLVLDMVTLTATVVGMIVFGHVADRVGRSALYGFEVIIVMAAIGGAAFSSAGFIIHQGTENEKESLNIYAALFFFRFLLGLGIGAEYPMSAVIASEFSPTKWRGVMLSAVFLAQAIGRLLAYGIGLGTLRGMSSSLDPLAPDLSDQSKIVMDVFWRLELGLAGIPAIFAIGFRLFIPETPRFYSAVKRDIKKARESLTMLGSRSPEMIADIERVMVSGPSDNSSVAGGPDGAGGVQRSWIKMARDYYFGPAKGWQPLAAISIQWLLLDVVFYGVGLDSPGTLAALWLNSEPPAENWGSLPAWNDDPAYPNATIVQTIDNNLVRTLELSSITGLAGSLVVIPLLGRVSRKTHYLCSTWILAALFACMAISVSQTYARPNHQVSMVFYAVAQFMFNVGPNTLTFVLAAEIFPTELRGTSYGIAAAAGKVGAIIVRPIIKKAGKGKDGLVPVLAVFSVVLALMALLVWLEPWGIAWPDVQRKRDAADEEEDEKRGWWERLLTGSRLVNESLEDIAPWPLDVTAGTRAGTGLGTATVTGTGHAREGSISESESESYHGSVSEVGGHEIVEMHEATNGNGRRVGEAKTMPSLVLPGPAL